MHVLVTADTIGGVWSYTRELVSGLLRRGHLVTLVSLGRMPRNEQAAWIEGKDINFYPTEFPLEWMPESEAGVAESVDFILRVIRKHNPDILHTSQFCYGALPCGIPKVLVAHSDVVSWWQAVHNCDPPGSPWFAWYRSLVFAGLADADLVVTPSQWMLDAICRHYDPPQRAQVIYNGRSSSLFHPTKRNIARVLSVGRVWDEGKQVSLLLARDHSAEILIAGDMKHPFSSVKNCAVGLNANVRICGEKNEQALRTLYSESSIYAATSRYEPFGLAPLEAAMSRCALIMNDIPSFREIWGDAGLYFQRNDPDSLAAAIQQLTAAADVCEEFADRAHSHAIRNYTAERMVDQYEALYRALATKGAYA